MNTVECKLHYLGYKTGIEKVNVGKNLETVYQLINKINLENFSQLEPITLEEIKRDAIKFYEKYFNIHDVQYITESDSRDIFARLKDAQDTLKAFKEYYEMLKQISPYDIPIKLCDGDSMVGDVSKVIITVPIEYQDLLEQKPVPFSAINLGKELTNVSTGTYIHELAHTQQERIIGYTNSILNKEVISIFLEKIYALEIDPTGKTLAMSERKRFMNLALLIRQVRCDGKLINLTDQEKVDSYSHIHSTLIAEKLFDMYLQERKQKKKDKYFYNIQDVFDGKITVEELLERHDVNINKGKDVNLIKRHI